MPAWSGEISDPLSLGVERSGTLRRCCSAPKPLEVKVEGRTRRKSEADSLAPDPRWSRIGQDGNPRWSRLLLRPSVVRRDGKHFIFRSSCLMDRQNGVYPMKVGWGSKRLDICHLLLIPCHVTCGIHPNKNRPTSRIDFEPIPFCLSDG
jgi:hypothetical protein